MKINTLIIILSIISVPSFGQSNESNELTRTIKKCDSLLFNIGFNNCNTGMLEQMLSDELKFYHDQNGITTSKKELIEGVRFGLCSLPYKAIRIADHSSTMIFPMQQADSLYGAIQNGTHYFYALYNDNQKFLTSVAKYSHLWMKENNKWKLNTGLSFDHHDIDELISQDSLFVNNNITSKYLNTKNVDNLAIGFISDGRIIQTSVFGRSNTNRSTPLETIWNVASLTKPITALICLKLIDQKKWSLDEPISKFFKDSDLSTDPNYHLVTTRHILSHQSGLPNWRGDTDSGKLEFQFSPGESYQYSGEAFDLLRRALEQKFNKPIQDLAEELIFSPVGMENTSFVWNDKYENMPIAKWYAENGQEYDYKKYKLASGADNLLTTIEDYSRFALYILQGAGLSTELQCEMTKSQVRISEYKHFGLGFWVDENINQKGEYALVHGGDDIGVHCMVFMLPATKKALVIFTNSDNGTAVYEDIIRFYLKSDSDGIFRAEMN